MILIGAKSLCLAWVDPAGTCTLGARRPYGRPQPTGRPKSGAASAKLCIGEVKIMFPIRAVTGLLPVGGNDLPILTERAVEAL